MKRRFALKATIAAAALGALTACAPANTGSDIVDIAAADGNFSTLVAAVQAAGLEDTLRGPGPFTVFAPTDAAFAALPAGTVDNLLLPENKDLLTSILTYHVVPGAIQAGDVLGTVQNVATVNGQTIRVDGTGSKFGPSVKVNNAAVTNADILATNGVIHVIDEVLLPD
ncbi:fasciclin domain-containing protein [Sulfitobacter sp. S190]|uniref:fasciclin domain-containing protein n=1 Tax=Sulfitobacter sp. S190 TaxID=2867022 RepID=UPI0021A948A9|nr:fasciclin domain-containing protein [Sulfitobacter sp. S190]UWR23683.1 fasciclin domain-containing protein [Sulfitobacter sp. S190]